MSEIREGTTYSGPTDTGWERGAIINHYSNGYGCWGASCNAANNNGNLMAQDYFIPTVDTPQPGAGQYTTVSQQFDYDSLNRLQDVHEGTSWKQQYIYDRFGNRTIDHDLLPEIRPPHRTISASPYHNRSAWIFLSIKT